MKKLSLAALAFAAPLIAFGAFAEDTSEGELHAWFTEEQAEAGQRGFAVGCGGCHGADMVDVFAGYDTAETYYLFISGSMPADNPGSLAPQQYVDIIAYLMREVGFPAGEETLTPDRAVLAEIVPGDAVGDDED